MDDQEFWRLIDTVPTVDRIEGRMAEVLSIQLGRLPIPRIIGFQLTLVDRCRDLLTWDLWEAAEVIHRERCSEDLFCDFRLWIVGQGEATFNQVLENPDSLAAVPKIAGLAGKTQWADSDYPHMGDLVAAAEMAYDEILAKVGPTVAERLVFPEELHERPKEIPDSAMPPDFGNEYRIREKYPRLIALYAWQL